MALRLGHPTTLRSGPWSGTSATEDPFQEGPDTLVDTRNGYFPNVATKSGFRARPGFGLLNAAAPLITSASPFRCQAIYAHTQLDGSSVNFAVMGGRLLRADQTYTEFTDVTPAGIVIDAGVTTRVYLASVIGILVVNDGVNRPWICADPSAATLSATPIDYDGHGVAWTALGPPVIYGGAVFFILNRVNGVARRADLSYSNPGTPLVGWQQDDFDNNWTLSQNEAGNLFVLVATNLALYYFRDRSIGYITGEVGPDLASTATEDAVGFNIGAQSPGLVQKFGNAILFGDANGRPYLFQIGGTPQDIWKQLRQVVDAATTGSPGTTQITGTSAIETNLNLYVAAIWSPTPSTHAPPVTLVVLDAKTGTYVGQWTVGPGIGIECVGNFVDDQGRATLIIAGSAAQAPAPGGYLWAFSGFSTTADRITAEDGVTSIAAEDGTTTGGAVIVTESTPANWMDNGEVPEIFVQTGRLGYDETLTYNVDQATIVTLTDTPCVVSVGTAASANVVEGTPSPSPSQDGTYRLPVGCDMYGRGPSVKVQPTTAASQWAIERIALRVVPSLAGPEDA